MAKQPVHVDIKRYIQDWKTARYGRQVRTANVNALTELQDQTNAAVDYIVEKGEDIDQAAQDVQAVRQESQAAVDHANEISGQNKQYVDDTVANYKQYADDNLAATEQQRQAAETARDGSEDAATLAESWAVGGTGSRQGEDGDNSKYHAEKSKESAEKATQEADRAAQYASIVAPGFLVDPATMELYIKVGVGVDFIVTADAELCWKIA